MAVGPYALTSLSNLKSWLGITASTDDAVLERAIDRATSRIESYLERNIKERSYAEWRSGAGVDTIRLHQWPVTTVTSVFSGNIAVMVIGAKGNNLRASISVTQEAPTQAVIATYTDIAGATTATSIPFATYPTVSDVAAQIGATGAYNATVVKNLRAVQMRPRAGADCVLATVTLFAADTASDYTYDHETGRLSIDESWWAYWPLDNGKMPDAGKSVLIEYRAGFETIPADMEECCLEVAAMIFRDRQRDKSLITERLGDYSYSRASQSGEVMGSSILAVMEEYLLEYREFA